MSTGGASVLAWTGTTTAVVAALALLGSGVLARSQAETAADLASLAGADALAVAHPHPCQVAAEVAERNGARLSSCELREWDVLVRVEVDAGPLPAMSARARAGPGPTELPET
jgi:secretion/DNA translocation related TadE-like protein